MVRVPTNTLIITQVTDELLKDPQSLLQFLADNQKNCELISLNRFGRILLICEDSLIAQDILNLLKHSEEFADIKITYSIQDNDIGQRYEVQETVDYLELPSEDGSRRFLISPPLSPPAEWDHWDKSEEGPNKQTVYDPDELSHLLWERLGGVDSHEVRKYDKKNERKRNLKIEPQVLFEDVTNGVPVIVLDRIDDDEPQNKQFDKTPLPPL